MQLATRLIGILSIASSLAACSGEALEAPEGEELPSSAVTTSPDIAVGNLNGQIDGLLRQIEIDPRNVATRESVVGLLLARTQYLGTYDDFDVAFAVVRDALDLGIEPARTAALHAKLLSAVHRFDAAIEEAERAESLGAESQTDLLESIALARGEDANEIAQERERTALATPSFQSYSAWAAALRSTEEYESSDAAYDSALATYRDVSPFPIAWVAFQRGLMWGEFADDGEEAYQQYTLAVQTLPQYVVGNVHLAELEVERGQLEDAVARLEALVVETQDPEPASRLGQFLRESDPVRAQEYANQARERYEHYLERYPLAFSDHACEFYLGAGDNAARALELALLNLENRATPRAYDLAIESALASSMESLACDLARQGNRTNEWPTCANE